MRIQCPFCGERGFDEFLYLGDGGFVRPDATEPQAQARFVEAVYFRDNPAGPHVELWYHESGCHSWLRVIRDTRTHEILAVAFAHELSHR
jgi:sarcosine oxidase subunit delta